MAKIRSHVVSRASCADVASDLGLGDDLARRGDSLPPDELERLTGNRNVLAALLEAMLAALYLENGFEAVEAPVVDAFSATIEFAINEHVDYKTELQEALARLGRSVTYSVLDVDGPPHDRRFTCAAVIDGEQAGAGEGSSKKEAEQAAAQIALEALVA